MSLDKESPGALCILNQKSFFLIFIFIQLFSCARYYCGMQNLQSSLRHMGSLFEACKLLVLTCEIQFLSQRQKLGPCIGNVESYPLDTREVCKPEVLMLIIQGWSWKTLKDKEVQYKRGEKRRFEGAQLALIKVVSRKSLEDVSHLSLPVHNFLERNMQKPLLKTVGYAEFSGGVPGAYLNC